jgi:hypothetical protein
VRAINSAFLCLDRNFLAVMRDPAAMLNSGSREQERTRLRLGITVRHSSVSLWQFARPVERLSRNAYGRGFWRGFRDDFLGVDPPQLSMLIDGLDWIRVAPKSRRRGDGSSQTVHNVVALLRPGASRLVCPVLKRSTLESHPHRDA